MTLGSWRLTVRLGSHVPSPCYGEAHSAWREAVEMFDQAFTSIDYGLTEPVTLQDVERGIEEMQRATELLYEASTAAEEVDC